ncbi:MAG: four helix bundle protein [Anaerolineae bacterium]|jgi:four helix bundle protein|nr:four helix bundle protein [Anaerolineae bacterium]MBT7782062.1 four helix bundle protein [Anaerolineae bacterium]
MATAKRFEELDVWQRSRELTNLIYSFTKEGNFSRDFALRDQIRRASISIMSNISEGFESSTQKTFIKYLGHAKASAGEVRAQLYIAKDQGYISEEDFEKTREMAEICSRQLSRFIQYLSIQPNSRRVRETGVTYDV